MTSYVASRLIPEKMLGMTGRMLGGTNSRIGMVCDKNVIGINMQWCWRTGKGGTDQPSESP